MPISLHYRAAALLSLLALFVTLPVTFAQAQPADRITKPANRNDLKRIAGSTYPLATKQYDSGRVEASLPMQRMVFVLRPSDLQSAALTNLIEAQKDPKSPSYRHWLTPEQFAAQFGPSQNDLHQITAWLALQGFSVGSIARGQQWIEFSGTAGQVEKAFHTEMHRYVVNNKMHVANASDISIPDALSPVVTSVLSLNDFDKPSLHSNATSVRRNIVTGKLDPVNDTRGPTPAFTSGTGTHLLAPGDYAKIYDTTPLLQSGTQGTGISIAIPGRTEINLADVQTFRKIFGLPVNDPIVIVNGPEPPVRPDDEVESDLDLQWAGAVAPAATIKFVTSNTTFTTDGIDLSNAYIIDNRVAPIMSLSYGLCEASMGAANAYYNLLYRQAAAEGITVFVASADNGAAGCDGAVSASPAQGGLAVNGLASTPYNVAVGGTQFNEGGNDANYWAATNGADYSSVLGYIPESVWNETCDPTIDPGMCQGTGYYFLFSSAGGASSVYGKPVWQAGTGVPNDGARDVPDLSLAAAGNHDGYLICVEGSCQTAVVNGQTVLQQATVVGGTSASSPSMAGIMALVEQQNGGYVGLANGKLYQLAANDNLASCNSSNLTSPGTPSTCVFHDVTMGDNSVPGLTGYTAGAGFDQSTGLGTVDAANLVSMWSSPPLQATVASLSLPSTTGQAYLVHGQPIPVTVVVSPASSPGTPTGDVSLIASHFGDSFGGTLTNGSFNGSVTDLPGGQYNLSAHYEGDATFRGSDSNSLGITVLPEDSTVSLVGWEINFVNNVIHLDPRFPPVYGQPVAFQVDVSGLSGVGSATGTFQINLDGVSLGTFGMAGGSGFLEVDHLPATTGLLPGNHRFDVTYNGDNSFYASAPASYSLSVVPGRSYTTVSAAGATTVAEGTPVLLRLAAAGDGVEQPTGVVQLYDNGAPIGNPLPLTLDGPLGPGTAQAVTSVLLPIGDHDLRLGWDGDSNYNATHGFDRFGETVTVTVSAADQIFKDGFDGP